MHVKVYAQRTPIAWGRVTNLKNEPGAASNGRKPVVAWAQCESVLPRGVDSAQSQGAVAGPR